MKKLLCASVLAVGATCAFGQLERQVYVNGLDRPVFITHAGDGSGRLFIIEQEGAIRVVDANDNLLPTPFLDIDPLVVGGTSGGDERGLLGLAFHPDYENNGLFYVNYTGGGGATRIVEYEVSGVADVANPASARVLMTISQPFSNHNGGWMDFGPDGYLYISTGDGGAGNDPGNRAARLNTLLGKILRIDVDNQDAGLEYAIPAGNPYADDGDAGTFPEIWHSGLRNAYRSSFDRENGDLWTADVGQNGWEEINHTLAGVSGLDYGWRCREGFQSTGLSCGTTGWTDPVHDYALTGGNCAVIGGYVYRGCELGEDYQGQYFFGDYCGGDIWTLDPVTHVRTTEFDFGFGLSSWGEDESGELYMSDLFDGTVYRLVNPNVLDANENGIPDACESSCPADLTGEGDLNFLDVSAFLTAFGNQDPVADFTGEGDFNFLDVSAFLAAFGKGCP